MSMNQFVVILSALVAGNSASVEDAVNHVMSSMGQYSTRVNPSQSGEPTKVNFFVSLQSIIEVNELPTGRAADITVVALLNYDWQDHRLKWDHEKLNARSIRLFMSDIWTPDISLFNSLQPSTPIRDDLAVIYYGGHVNLVPSHIFKIRCPKKKGIIRCTMTFGSWTYDGLKLNLTPQYHEIGMHDFDDLSSYRVTNTSLNRNVKYYECCPTEPYIEIKAKFDMQAY